MKLNWIGMLMLIPPVSASLMSVAILGSQAVFSGVFFFFCDFVVSMVLASSRSHFKVQHSFIFFFFPRDFLLILEEEQAYIICVKESRFWRYLPRSSQLAFAVSCNLHPYSHSGFVGSVGIWILHRKYFRGSEIFREGVFYSLIFYQHLNVIYTFSRANTYSLGYQAGGKYKFLPSIMKEHCLFSVSFSMLKAHKDRFLDFTINLWHTSGLWWRAYYPQTLQRTECEWFAKM